LNFLGIRGGLVQASMRYATANNEQVPDYDDTKPKSWLIYQDCNNLYGYAMCKYMPYGGFKWVEPTLRGLNDLDDSSHIGRIYEVDIAFLKIQCWFAHVSVSTIDNSLIKYLLFAPRTHCMSAMADDIISGILNVYKNYYKYIYIYNIL